MLSFSVLRPWRSPQMRLLEGELDRALKRWVITCSQVQRSLHWQRCCWLFGQAENLQEERSAETWMACKLVMLVFLIVWKIYNVMMLKYRCQCWYSDVNFDANIDPHFVANNYVVAIELKCVQARYLQKTLPTLHWSRPNFDVDNYIWSESCWRHDNVVSSRVRFARYLLNHVFSQATRWSGLVSLRRQRRPRWRSIRGSIVRWDKDTIRTFFVRL